MRSSNVTTSFPNQSGSNLIKLLQSLPTFTASANNTPSYTLSVAHLAISSGSVAGRIFSSNIPNVTDTSVNIPIAAFGAADSNLVAGIAHVPTWAGGNETWANQSLYDGSTTTYNCRETQFRGTGAHAAEDMSTLSIHARTHFS